MYFLEKNLIWIHKMLLQPRNEIYTRMITTVKTDI